MIKNLQVCLIKSLFFMIVFAPSIFSQTLELTGSINGVHDPVIAQENGNYYLFSTGPGVPIRCSDDLLEWRLCSAVFFGLPKWIKEEVPAVGDLWAPDISYFNGRYQIFYSASSFGENSSAIGLATNLTLDPNHPDYNWQDEGLIIKSESEDNFNAIDPNFVLDAQAKPWLSFGSFWTGIKLVELNPLTLKPINSNFYAVASRPGNTAIEAPFVVYREGYYYLFISFDQCCQGVNSSYNIRFGRAKGIEGPYIDRAGKALLESGGTLLKAGGDRYKGTGHNAIITLDAQDYLVYHAYDAEDHGISKLRIETLVWQDGWPVIEE